MFFDHPFIVKPFAWKGEGKIILNMVDEILSFSTRWEINEKDETGKILSVQHLQIMGISEEMKNDLVFFDFTPKGFSVEMENDNIGKIVGRGLIDEQFIAWEFRNNTMQFEGYETYRLQNDKKSYLVHAEYVTTDQFRTQIEGTIWPEVEKNS